MFFIFIDMEDNNGDTPLDGALRLGESGCVEVAYYLISRGYGKEEDKTKLLCEACKQGELSVVKKLVEKHKVDPVCKFCNVMSTKHTCNKGNF